MTDRVAIQDQYPESLSHCYGCGRLNEHGLQIKSYTDGDEAVCRFTARPEHMALPGYVYGGLLASLIDCHATGTAAIAAYRAQGRAPGTEPAIRFVTASLKVDYHRPTPLGPVLELRARAREVAGRKVWLDVEVSAEGLVCVTGEVLCIQMPPEMGAIPG